MKWMEVVTIYPPNTKGKLLAEMCHDGESQGTASIRLAAHTNGMTIDQMIPIENSLIKTNKKRWRLLESDWFSFPTFQESPVLLWIEAKAESGYCKVALVTVVFNME